MDWNVSSSKSLGEVLILVSVNVASLKNRIRADLIKTTWGHAWVGWTLNPIWLVSRDRNTQRAQAWEGWGQRLKWCCFKPRTAGATRSLKRQRRIFSRLWRHHCSADILVLDFSLQNSGQSKFLLFAAIKICSDLLQWPQETRIHGFRIRSKNYCISLLNIRLWL